MEPITFLTSFMTNSSWSQVVLNKLKATINEVKWAQAPLEIIHAIIQALHDRIRVLRVITCPSHLYNCMIFVHFKHNSSLFCFLFHPKGLIPMEILFLTYIHDSSTYLITQIVNFAGLKKLNYKSPLWLHFVKAHNFFIWHCMAKSKAWLWFI